MWSEYTLDVVDAVARTGSFSAAAEELHGAFCHQLQCPPAGRVAGGSAV